MGYDRAQAHSEGASSLGPPTRSPYPQRRSPRPAGAADTSCVVAATRAGRSPKRASPKAHRHERGVRVGVVLGQAGTGAIAELAWRAFQPVGQSTISSELIDVVMTNHKSNRLTAAVCQSITSVR